MYVKGFCILLLNERLRECRSRKGLTQTQVAAAVDISLRSYKYYESGEQAPSIKALAALADFFGVSIDYLVGRTDRHDVNR